MSTLTLKELSAPTGEVIKIAAGKTLALNSQGTLILPTVPSAKMPAGSVLQVKIAYDTSVMTTSSATYVATGLQLAITPSSTSSKILCFWNVQARSAVASKGFGTQLLRGSTTLFTSATNYAVYAGGAADVRMNGDWKHLDSPNTTSEITYSIKVSAHGGGTLNFNDASNQTSIVLMEIQG